MLVPDTALREPNILSTLRNRLARAALLVLAPVLIVGCGINNIPTNEERAKAQ